MVLFLLTMNRVVLEEIHQILNILGIVDSHDLELVVGILDGLAEHKTADTTETIDTNSD